MCYLPYDDLKIIIFYIKYKRKYNLTRMNYYEVPCKKQKVKMTVC